MNKKIYETPEIELKLFSGIEVIVASVGTEPPTNPPTQPVQQPTLGGNDLPIQPFG